MTAAAASRRPNGAMAPRGSELAPPLALNNGVAFAATRFVMLPPLFFSGGGRYISIDYGLQRRLHGGASC